MADTRGWRDIGMGKRKITAEGLRTAKWVPSSFASGRDFYIQDFTCVDFPRVVLRLEPGRQTMLVDGRDVGGSEAAAEALNAPLPAPPGR